MSDNPYKRAICNRALNILVAGKTSNSGLFFTSITDSEFADWTKVSEQDNVDKRLVCQVYEQNLKRVIEDIVPDFAIAYADLGQPHKVNKAFNAWDYLFELPTDFLAPIAQISEGNPDSKHGFKCEVMHFTSYSHVVTGDDDQAYYCSTSHTSVDDTDDGQPSDDDGEGNWTLYNTDGGLGATWAEAVDYKAAATGKMLATNALTNIDGDAAYIKYLAYVQAGRSDQPQYYPEAFSNALATRLAAEMALHAKDYERRRQLLEEYESLAKPAYWAVQGRHQARTKHVTIFEARSR